MQAADGEQMRRPRSSEGVFEFEVDPLAQADCHRLYEACGALGVDGVHVGAHLLAESEQKPPPAPFLFCFQEVNIVHPAIADGVDAPQSQEFPVVEARRDS